MSAIGSVCTTKTRSDPQRVGMCSGEMPIGTAKDKRLNTEALCQTSPLIRLQGPGPPQHRKTSEIAETRDFARVVLKGPDFFFCLRTALKDRP